MAVYRIDRTLEGVDDDEMSAAAFRALACQRRYPGVRWIRSIVDSSGARGTCIYEAPSVSVLEVHQRESELVWDSITEILEILPEQFA